MTQENLADQVGIKEKQLKRLSEKIAQYLHVRQI